MHSTSHWLAQDRRALAVVIETLKCCQARFPIWTHNTDADLVGNRLNGLVHLDNPADEEKKLLSQCKSDN